MRAARRLCGLVLLIGGVRCAPPADARAVNSHSLDQERGWLRVRGVPEVLQDGDKDCGAAALSAVLGYWGYPTSAREVLRELRPARGRGLRAGDLVGAARARGLQSFVFYGSLHDLTHELGERRPVIVGVVKPIASGWRSHYEVLLGYNATKNTVLTLDPALGLRERSVVTFTRQWAATDRVMLVISAQPDPG